MRAKRINRFISLFVALVTATAFLGVPQPVKAGATITVNSAKDEIKDDHLCTLREAIIATNENIPFGGCPQGTPNGMDTIYLPNWSFKLERTDAQYPGESDPARGDLDITDSLTIVGSGSNNNITMIYAQDDFFNRLIHVKTKDKTDQVILTNLRLWNGNSNGNYNDTVGVGGAIFNDVSSLLVNRLIIEGNRSGKTGGGISNNAGSTLVVNASSILSNTSYDGGGIWNKGTMTISNTLFWANTASNSGGGIKNNSTTALAKLTNVTLSANTSGLGAGIATEGTMEILNSTIYYNNGIGIRAAANASIENSIIAGEGSSERPNCSFDPQAKFVSKGHNLENYNQCRLNTAIGDMVNKSPMIQGNLGNYGGPTQTLQLAEGSPAINAANPKTCPATDQRLYPRFLDGGCDIGAFEFGSKTVLFYIPLVTR